MRPLLRELLQAHRTAWHSTHSGVGEALADCGLAKDQPGPLWGIDFVEIDAQHYQPVLDGKMAIIVPCFEDGALVDLVACGLATRSCRTRTGICTVLGREWLDHARDYGTAARLLPDPIEWLRNDR